MHFACSLEASLIPNIVVAPADVLARAKTSVPVPACPQRHCDRPTAVRQSTAQLQHAVSAFAAARQTLAAARMESTPLAPMPLVRIKYNIPRHENLISS